MAAFAFAGELMDEVGIDRLIEQWIANHPDTPTNEAFGERVEVSGATVGRWRNGRHSIKVKHQPAVAAELGITVEELREAMEETERFAKSGVILERRGVPAAAPAIEKWSAKVTSDGALSLLARMTMLRLPHFIEEKGTMEVFISKLELIDAIPEITESNVDSVWEEIVQSGHVVKLSSRVFRLVDK